jgi:hypothetical protein
VVGVSASCFLLLVMAAMAAALAFAGCVNCYLPVQYFHFVSTSSSSSSTIVANGVVLVVLVVFATYAVDVTGRPV